MTDFLKNLRSSHKKEASIHRRPPDNPYFGRSERLRPPERPPEPPDNLELLLSSLNDFLPALTDTIEQLSNHLEKDREESRLLVEAQIRQHNAISNFFDNMNRFFCETAGHSQASQRSKTTASYTSGTHYTKDDILEIIRMMRNKGATFSVIATYLKDKGIPTFSGRGEWHAQTIHRLCK